MARVSLESAFVLHARPFRDTSLLLDLFTINHGRISAIARGVRSAKSKRRGLLLPFVPLLLSWSGKTDLMTITKVEAGAAPYCLGGNALLSGFYLNELLVRLLHRHDAYPNIYNSYQNTLTDMQNSQNIQVPLRLFEKRLLAGIGYGLPLEQAADGSAIDPALNYSYEHGVGFVAARRGNSRIALDGNLQGRKHSFAPTEFSGTSLLALANDDLTDSKTLQDAKKLMRLVFAMLLGGKPLKSRELLAK